MTENSKETPLLYKLDDRPSVAAASFAGLQHVLAMFGGILTAPLIVALGMGLDAADTTYVIAAALVVSGFATLVQVNRLGPLGTGLLSVQGTSFAFIGPLIFSYEKLVLDMSSSDALGVIFGSSVVCGLVVMGLSVYIKHLRNIITNNVAGATIILLGLSLVFTTLSGLQREFLSAGGLAGDGLKMLLLAFLVFIIILFLSLQRLAWLRLSSITLGLAIGVAVASFMGLVDFSDVHLESVIFIPEIGRYPLGVDLQIIAILMPIYLVSAMESVGDITATANLSGLSTEGEGYWSRMRGGIMAGAFASMIASLLSTFPSTTFSQNNGVIRLTGVASRFVGSYVAIFLVLLGISPLIARLFQTIPSVVVYGGTLLMFMLVVLSGFRVVQGNQTKQRDYLVVGLAILFGYGISTSIQWVSVLPSGVVTILQFPVSTGAMCAILLELIVPRQVHAADTSD